MLVRVASTPRLEVRFSRCLTSVERSGGLSGPQNPRDKISLAVRSADLLADQITTLAAAKELLIG